ncbi:hypothetical protein ASC95_14260 [Pelomonas sp. Root1217]|uniref:hypothetical protein n=1 Tax=Pelomonas sp. Root1217 TaxID=1736430 RepID=UPI0007149078|nr:hypothetical protein [Pelomonas sp. Root1217]KQV50526.1 hypothetical protein ASC95_14260 [Pelomonas sp. Root1217]
MRTAPRLVPAARAEIESLRDPAVQSWTELHRRLGARTAALQRVARETYRQWRRQPLLRLGFGLGP